MIWFDFVARLAGIFVSSWFACSAWQRWVDSWALQPMREAAWQGRLGFPIFYVALHGGGGFTIPLVMWGLWSAL